MPDARARTSPLQTSSQRLNPVTPHAMLTAPHYLATQAGIALLRQGGTAIDAAIGAAAVLSVVYPHMCSIGGDNFWLIYGARAGGELRGLNACGRAGAGADIGFYASAGMKSVPERGYGAAVTVPGAVSGWDAAFRYSRERLGSPLAWAQLFEDAIDYAEHGFPVSASLEACLTAALDTEDAEYQHLQRFSGFRAVFSGDGAPHRVGSLLRQPDLAATLRAIALHGAEAFYAGAIGAAMAEELAANGSPLTREDFLRHRPVWVEPLTTRYRDCTACNLPPNTQGLTSLQILNILDRFDLGSIAEGSADYYHLLLEAAKRAIRDRDRHITDPDFAPVPVARLLSAAYADAMRADIRMDVAAPPPDGRRHGGDTVWLGAVDRHGNAVSLIQSIYHPFGSGIIPQGTGVILQNRGCAFSLDPGHVNRLEPGKRTFHTLNPAMLLREGRPFLVYGTMGGEGQPQTQSALVTRIVDYGMSPQEAVAAPRWLFGRTWGSVSGKVRLEGRIPGAVIAALTARGHDIEVVEAWSEIMGHAGVILVDAENSTLQGAADPRGDGLAAGY